MVAVTNHFKLVINDTIDGLDHLIACFPYCASSSTVNGEKTSSRCIPKSSRCKKKNLANFKEFLNGP